MDEQQASLRFIAPGAATPKTYFKAKDLLRFARKIRQQGECWRWTGRRDKKGYGQLWHEGQARWAHRLSYAVFIGEIPFDQTIDHSCHNSWCCNPAHLRILSRGENSTDANVRRWNEQKSHPPEEPTAETDSTDNAATPF